MSNHVAFANPNAPVYPRIAQGKEWNEVSSISKLLLTVFFYLRQGFNHNQHLFFQKKKKMRITVIQGNNMVLYLNSDDCIMD